MSVLKELTINRFFTYVAAGTLFVEQLRTTDKHESLPAIGLMIVGCLTTGFLVESVARIVGSQFRHPANHKPRETFRQRFWDLT